MFSLIEYLTAAGAFKLLSIANLQEYLLQTKTGSQRVYITFPLISLYNWITYLVVDPHISLKIIILSTEELSSLNLLRMPTFHIHMSCNWLPLGNGIAPVQSILIIWELVIYLSDI